MALPIARPIFAGMARPFKLPEITFPLTVDTIGKELAMGRSFHLSCHNEGCHHDGEINLVQLGYRLGFDHGSMHNDIIRYFYCSPCRQKGKPDRNISLRVSPPGAHSDWPRKHHEPDPFKRGVP